MVELPVIFLRESCVPNDAKLITRNGHQVAVWVAKNGIKKTAQTCSGSDGELRIRQKSSTYVAKYKNAEGRMVEESTGCKDKRAALSFLNQKMKAVELVKAGVMTSEEQLLGSRLDQPLSPYLSEYNSYQTSKGLHKGRIKTSESRIRRINRDCGFKSLRDITSGKFEAWLSEKAEAKMSPANRNENRQAMIGFLNWCVKTGKLPSNPLSQIPKADAKSDPQRVRRALDIPDLLKLLQAARIRPLKEAMTISRGKEKGKLRANLKPETRRELEYKGLERSLIYKTLALTGLRRGELESITIGQVALNENPPYLLLKPKNEKNRKGSRIPLRDDLVRDLRLWLDLRLSWDQEEAQQLGKPLPEIVSPQQPLFEVPKALVKILNRDLKLAGIPKKDHLGRTVDVHSLRMTFGTHLNKAGVAPRTAQKALRHSTIDLTMNVYTDPELLDVAHALNKLPQLDLMIEGRDLVSELKEAEESPEDGRFRVAPDVAPEFEIACKNGPSETLSSFFAELPQQLRLAYGYLVNTLIYKYKKSPSPSTSNRLGIHFVVGVTGFEPTTSTSRT